MITAEEAYNIGKKYLDEKKRDYISIFPLKKIKKFGYTVQWGTDTRTLGITIDALQVKCYKP